MKFSTIDGLLLETPAARDERIGFLATAQGSVRSERQRQNGLRFELEVPCRRCHSIQNLASILSSNSMSRKRQKACNRQLFNAISSGKEMMTEGDVQKFAIKHGLPLAYVKPFFSSMSAFSNRDTGGVPYKVFDSYVSSREKALRKIFNKLDRDRDGKLSPEEMRIGLSHMLFDCANTRCCYRSNAACLTTSCVSACRSSVDFCTFRKFFLLLPQDKMMVEYWVKASHPSCCDVGARPVYPDDTKKANASPVGHLVAGAIAGATSRTATAPLETLRILAMTGSLSEASGTRPAGGGGGVGSGRGRGPPRTPEMAQGGHVAAVPRSPTGHAAGASAAATAATSRGGGAAAKAMGPRQMAQAAAGIVRTQGWKALYRGNIANVAKSAPQKALDFFTFDIFKELISARRSSPTGRLAATTGGPATGPSKAEKSNLGTAGTLAAAGMAGAVSSSILYPLEVVRTRMCTDTAGVYKGVGHAFSLIVRKEGPLALYRGLGPSVAAILPEAAITYGLFDLLKRGLSRAGGEEGGVLPTLTAGVAAAFTGQAVAYPLETISRRMQVSSNPTTALGALHGIITEGGVGALFRGLGAASIRVIPMAVVSFGTYEWVRSQYTHLEEAWAVEAAEQELRMIPSQQLEGCQV